MINKEFFGVYGHCELCWIEYCGLKSNRGIGFSSGLKSLVRIALGHDSISSCCKTGISHQDVLFVLYRFIQWVIFPFVGILQETIQNRVWYPEL